VVVAACAIHRQTEPHRGSGLRAVEDAFHAKFLGINATFGADAVVAVKSSGQDGFGAGIGQQITGRLQQGEAVEGHVGVVGLDDPVAPSPHRTFIVLLETMAVGVTRSVEPRRGQTFAVAG